MANPFDIAYADDEVAAPPASDQPYQFAGPASDPASNANPFDIVELQDLSQTVKTPEDKLRFNRIVADRLAPKLPVRSAAEDILPSVGRGMRQAGQVLVAGLADIGQEMTGQRRREEEARQRQFEEDASTDYFSALQKARDERESQQTNIEAAIKGEPLQAETQMKALPTPLRVMGRASQGLIETVPKLALVMGAEAVGIPAPVAAGAVFGTTEEGFSPKEAAIAAALPFVGKYGGQLSELIAKKLGVPSDAALDFINGVGSTTAAGAYLATIQASEIANLPKEDRKDAIIEAVAGVVGQAMLGPMGKKRLPQSPGEVAGRALWEQTSPRDAGRERAVADMAARDMATPQQLDWQGLGPRPRPSVEEPQIGVPPGAKPAAAYQFGTGTETRNEPAPVSELVPISPGGVGVVPALSNAVEHEGRRYEKRGGVWFALDTPEGRPIFRNTENKKRLIADLEQRLQGKEPSARNIPSAEVIPEREVRPPVGEETPLRQQGEAPASQPVPPAPVAPPEAPAAVVAPTLLELAAQAKQKFIKVRDAIVALFPDAQVVEAPNIQKPGAAPQQILLQVSGDGKTIHASPDLLDEIGRQFQGNESEALRRMVEEERIHQQQFSRLGDGFDGKLRKIWGNAPTEIKQIVRDLIGSAKLDAGQLGAELLRMAQQAVSGAELTEAIHPKRGKLAVAAAEPLRLWAKNAGGDVALGLGESKPAKPPGGAIESRAPEEQAKSAEASRKMVEDMRKELEAMSAPTPAAEVPKPAEPTAGPAGAKPPTAERLAEIRKERDSIHEELRKIFGRSPEGVDPTILPAVARLVANHAKEGVVRFEDFARRVKDELPEMWDQLRTHLRGAWNYAAEQLGFDEISRAGAERVFDDIRRGAIAPPAEPAKLSEFIARRSAEKRAEAPEVAKRNAEIEAEIKKRGGEATPELTQTNDPEFQVGTWINRAHAKLSRGMSQMTQQGSLENVSRLLRLWPSLANADIRTLRSQDTYNWLEAMAQKADRQARVGKLSDELVVNAAQIKTARRWLVSALTEAGHQGKIEPVSVAQMKAVGLKLGRTLSSQVTMPDAAQADGIVSGLTGKYRDLGQFMRLTGVRIGEVLKAFKKEKFNLPEVPGLTWAEVDLERGRLDLRRKRTKNKLLTSEQRVVNLSPDAIAFLRDLKQRKAPKSDSEEIFGDIESWNVATFNKQVRRAALANGISIPEGRGADAIRSDLFRKMYATDLEGVLSKEEIAAQLGDTVAVVDKWYKLRPSLESRQKKLEARGRTMPTPAEARRGVAPEVGTQSIATDDFVNAEPLQPRADKFAEATAAKVGREGWNPQESAKSPPLLWRDPETGKLYRAGGSSRAEGLRRLAASGGKLPESVDVLFSNAKSKEEAFAEAISNNIVSTPESFVDTASAVAKARKEGIADGKIAELRRISSGDVDAYAAFNLLPETVKRDFKPVGTRAGARPSQSEDVGLLLGATVHRKILSVADVVADYNEASKDGRVNENDLRSILNSHERYQAKINEIQAQGVMFGEAEMKQAAKGWQAFRKDILKEIAQQRRLLNSLRAAEKANRSLEAAGRSVSDAQRAVALEYQAEAEKVAAEMAETEKRLLDGLSGLAPKPAPPEPPKLRPGEKGTGELLQGSEAPFNLAGEKGSDAERIAKEKADAEAAAQTRAEFERKNQQDMFGGDKPPANRPGFTADLPTKEEAMTRGEVEAKISKEDAAGFPVKVVTRAEATALDTSDVEASTYRGFFDNETRAIYLVHENLRRTDTGEVAAIVREEAAHGLLRTVDGNRLLYELLGRGRLELTATEKQALRDQGYENYQLLDEFIAKSAAENLPWWKAALERVRAFLSKLGLASLSNAEVSRVLVRQIRAINDAGGTPATSDAAFGRLTPSRTTEEDARRIYGQVMGIRRAGGQYSPENIGAIQAKLRGSERYNFGPDTAVTTENTQRAFEAVSNLIDLPTAESELMKIRDVAPEQMAPGLLLSDLFRYGVKAMMGKGGDPSLVYFIAENYDRINIATGPMGPRGVGRALRALREGASDPTLVNLLQLFDAIEAAASTRLYGKEKLGEIARIARDIEDGVPGEIAKPGVAPEIEQKLKDKGLTPEIAWMLGLMKRYQEWNTEWKKPEYRDSLLTEIKKVVKDWETRNLSGVDQPLGGRDFQGVLSDVLFSKAIDSINAENTRREKFNENRDIDDQKPLIELDDELRGVLRSQMRDLAREIWLRKTAANADRRPNAEQRWAESALNKWETDQTEWLKPEKLKGEAQKRIEEFMDLAPFRDEQQKAVTDKLRDELVAAGLLPNTAFQLAEAAWQRKLTFEANAKLKADKDAADKIWNESEGIARQFVARYLDISATVEQKNAVREAIKRAMRLRPASDELATYGAVDASRRVDPVSNVRLSETLLAELKKAGVSPETANQVARVVQLERLFRWNSANARTMERAAKSRRITGLMQELLDAPVLMQKSPQWRRDVAMRWFESSGLSREDAIRAAEIFTQEFDAQLAAAGERLAQQIGKREKFGERFNEFVQAVRAGMLDPSKPWSAKFAESKGIRLPTLEEMKQLAELDAKLEDARVNGDERDMAEIASQMTSIYSKMHLPPELMKLVAANVVATNLTGLRTLVVQGSPMVFTALDRAFATLASPHRIGEIWMPVFRAMNGMLSEVRLALSKDAYTFVHNEMGPASNELKRLWEVGLDDVRSGNRKRQAKGVVKMLYGSQQYFLRLLNAFDQASGVMVRESQLVLYGARQMREAGFTSSEVADWVQATHQLKQAAYLTSLGKGDSKMRAKVHADSLGAEMIRESLQERLISKVGDTRAVTMANEAWKGAENDAYSVLGRRGKNISEREEGGLLSRYGFLHTLLDVSSKLRSGDSQSRILAVTLLGYLNVPIRTARFYAWNSPYGLMRMGIHYGRKHFLGTRRGVDYYESNRNWWKQSLSNEYQANYRLKNALAATAVQAVLTAAGIAYFGQSWSEVDTKKDNQIFVTGDGPKNPGMRDAWLKAGFRPNSVVMFVGGKPATVPFTRLGEAMGHMFIILAARDDYNWRKKEKEATGKPFKETWDEMGGYFLGGYASMLMGRGPLATVSRWARAGGAEGGAKAALASGLAGVASSVTMPYLGTQRTIRDVAMGRVDTSSISSAMAANFPVLGAFQNRAINRFGDPLGNRQWSAIVSDAGGVVSFQIEDNSQNRKLYQALVAKGVFPPVLRRGVLEEKYGEMSNSDFGTFAQRSGDMLKKATLANLSVIAKQPPEEAKKTLSRLATSADNVAAKGLGLEPVASRASSGGGMSLPAASASSGGLLGGNAGVLAGGSGSRGNLLGGAGLLGGGRASGGIRASRPRRINYGSRGTLRGGRSRRLPLRSRRPRLTLGNRRLTTRLRRPAMRRRRLTLA